MPQDMLKNGVWINPEYQARRRAQAMRKPNTKQKVSYLLAATADRLKTRFIINF